MSQRRRTHQCDLPGFQIWPGNADGLSKCGPKMHAQCQWLKQFLAAWMNKQPVSLLDSEVNFSPKVVDYALVLAHAIYFHLASFYR